jgi:ELWxxDGT repeat protein
MAGAPNAIRTVRFPGRVLAGAHARPPVTPPTRAPGPDRAERRRSTDGRRRDFDGQFAAIEQAMRLHAPALSFACLATCTATAQQLVAELDAAPPVAGAANAAAAVAGAGFVWFAADSWNAGRELFRTDGTVAGTRLWLDHRPGPQGSHPRPLAVVGARLVFHASNPLANEYAVWSSDGTAAGTTRLYGAIDSITNVRALGTAGGRVLLTDDRGGQRVLGSDLTAAGTALLATFTQVGEAVAHNGELLLLARSSDSRLYATDGTTIVERRALGGIATSGFAARGGEQFFVVDAPSGHSELWRTDGTHAGTQVVVVLGTSQGPASIGSLGTTLVIGAAGRLFTSDGTATGTVPLLAAGGAVRAVTPIGAVATFTRRLAASGADELWRTDGTLAGTQVVSAAPRVFRHVAAAPGRMFAFATPASGIGELVSSDGTAAGTRVLQVGTDPAGESIAVLGAQVIVTTTPWPTGPSPHAHATDGTAANTVQLSSNLVPAGVRAVPGAVALGERLLFVADTAPFGAELWRTDGTAAGTTLVQDLAPGPANGVRDLVAFQGAAWFASGNRLHRSDGTATGTSFALQPDPAASSLWGVTAGADHLLFRTDAGIVNRLWRSDGTPAGTVELDSASGTWVQIQQWRQVGALTYFVRLDGFQRSLWRTDGTAAGKVQLAPAHGMLGAIGDVVVFHRPAAAGHELLATRGTLASTVGLGTTPALPLAGATFGGRLVWTDLSGAVHATDGAGGIVSLPVPAVVEAPVVGTDGVYLVTADPVAGRALYRTDGTAAGTTFVSAMGSGAAGVLTAAPIGAGNRLFLAGDAGANGVEPWISDGTAAGTLPLGDLHVGGSSNPQWLGVAGRTGYFLAEDGTHGRELWKVELGAIGAANVQPFGAGCPGAAGVPRVAIDGVPRPGGAPLLELDRAPPASIALWLVGTGTGGLPVGGGCVLLLTDLYFLLWNVTDGAGRASTPLALPADPALIGAMATVQGSVLDPIGASAFGTSATAGLLLVLGAN